MERGYASYSPDNINTALATDNILQATATAQTTLLQMTADRSMYTLNLEIADGTAGLTLTNSAVNTLDLGGHTLTLTGGGLLAGISNDFNGIVIQNGNLTSGTAGVGGDLYVHSASYGGSDRTTTISANIIDNAGGAVALVIDGDLTTGSGGANSVTLTGNNTYSGGTFLNSGLLIDVAGANGTTVTAIPGDITVSGGFAINTNAFGQTAQSILRIMSDSQIKNTATITLNGGSEFDLNNFNQTIANLVINNDGGSLSTAVSIGTGTFTLTGGVTATSSDVGLTPTITAGTGGTLVLTPGAHTFDIDAIRFESTGTSAANIAANGPDLATLRPTFAIQRTHHGRGRQHHQIRRGHPAVEQHGQHFRWRRACDRGRPDVLGQQHAHSRAAADVVSRPFGTGTLVMDAGTTLLIDTASRTIGNNVIFNGDPIFDTTSAGAVTMTLNGTITFAPTAGVVNISIANPALTVALLGPITNAASITTVNKTGLGTLILNLNGFGGNINAGAGPLTLLFDGNGTW